MLDQAGQRNAWVKGGVCNKHIHHFSFSLCSRGHQVGNKLYLDSNDTNCKNMEEQTQGTNIMTEVVNDLMQ